MADSRTKIIQEMNDRFRKGDDTIPGQIVMTSGVKALLEESGKTMSDLAKMVQEFDVFTEDNDPHHEHDFGKFSFAGEDCYWKIDLYNSTYDGGSEDPTDPAKTCRVLTVLFPHEY